MNLIQVSVLWFDDCQCYLLENKIENKIFEIDGF